ncbi:MAG: hypothetical protein ACOYOF_16160 [Verrucomicrobiaceae bacterium]
MLPQLPPTEPLLRASKCIRGDHLYLDEFGQLLQSFADSRAKLPVYGKSAIVVDDQMFCLNVAKPWNIYVDHPALSI